MMNEGVEGKEWWWNDYVRLFVIDDSEEKSDSENANGNTILRNKKKVRNNPCLTVGP